MPFEVYFLRFCFCKRCPSFWPLFFSSCSWVTSSTVGQPWLGVSQPSIFPNLLSPFTPLLFFGHSMNRGRTNVLLRGACSILPSGDLGISLGPSFICHITKSTPLLFFVCGWYPPSPGSVPGAIGQTCWGEHRDPNQRSDVCDLTTCKALGIN